MGLETRRKIRELTTSTFPERTRELKELTGAEVKYDVDWESFHGDSGALDFVDSVSCRRAKMALRLICADEHRRAAVRDGLRTIKLKNVPDRSAMRIAFEHGVLEMHCAYALRAGGMFSDGEIRQVLANAL
jgi:hypothetical protein